MGKKDPIRRPKRWDEPFDARMNDEMVDQLMTIAPFSEMDPQNFPEATSLREILKNDTRIVELTEGDIVIREGEYGSSAFLILNGQVDVALKNLPSGVLGKGETRKLGFFESLSQLWSNPSHPEVRSPDQIDSQTAVKTRVDESGTRVFLQDVPAVLDENGKATINKGEIFGELAALSRTPRTATVIARGNVALLEIRWQGLRDIIRRDKALKKQVEELYRRNSLASHLRSTPIFANLSNEEINQIAEATEFATYGDFEWQHKYMKSAQRDPHSIIRKEPVIVKEEDYPNGLILIRNGFARVSRTYADGEKTESYLGKGQYFGLREIYHNMTQLKSVGWRNTLRAVGYVDCLVIPTSLVESLVIPSLDEKPRVFKSNSDLESTESQVARGYDKIETSLLEFLVENRFINGTQTMMIDLDRCTRCDDCIRACASTHGNNPRFVRHGAQHKNLMIANACMHCVDPVCMIGCPTGAIGRDAKTGSVTINEGTCVGCATCANSCPYDNIKMVELNDQSGQPMLDEESSLPILKATKCDLCSSQSTGPACQRACPHDALVRIDLSGDRTLSEHLNQ